MHFEQMGLIINPKITDSIQEMSVFYTKETDTRKDIGMQQTIYHIDAFWDTDAVVWVATSDDVPGLATEADTIEALSQKLRDRVPDLLLLNGVISADFVGAIAIQLTSHRQELIEVAS
jgi:Domain of unknown function (DUF1902)